MALSPTQRALNAASTKDDALKVYDAAVAAAATKYKGTTGRKYKKSVATYKKSFDNRVSEIDKAYADASKGPGGGVTGSTPDSKTGGTKPPDSQSNLTDGASSESEDGPNFLLWAGAGALIWYFWKK